MRRYRHFSNSETSTSQVDISPLIDVVFILLIFFIVTTVFVKNSGVDVDMPPRVPTAQDLDNQSVIIAVTKTGQVYYGGRNIGIGGVEAAIRSVSDEENSVAVIIEADKAAPTGATVPVIDAARRAKAKSVSLATKD